MSSLIIWLEKYDAKIFELSPNGIDKCKISHKGPWHENSSKVDEVRFYEQLIQALQKYPSSEWYVMGPGLAKDHFKHYLEKHYPLLDGRVKGCAKKDILTDEQIIQEGARFFRHEHLFVRI